MCLRAIVLFLLLLCPLNGSAQQVAEELLPSNTQFYFRWDGQDAHAEAFKKTAIGKVMQGDMGELFDYVGKQLGAGLKGIMAFQHFLSGGGKEEGKRLQSEIDKILNLWSMLKKHGIVIAISVDPSNMKSIQGTLIIPNAGKDADPLFALLRLVTTMSKIPVKSIEDNNRTIHTIPNNDVGIGWWMEGQHAVFAVGTQSITTIVRQMSGGRQQRLIDNSNYKEISRFKDFETAARAFIDFDCIFTMLGKLDPRIATGLKTSGLTGLKSLRFLSGFEDAAERSIVELRTTERTGLLKAFNQKTFTIKDVPSLPKDVVSWSMSRVDLGVMYDSILMTIKEVAKGIDPRSAQAIPEMLQQVDRMLGVDLRKDLIGSLGNQIVQYASPSEGILGFSQTVMIQLKDSAKFSKTLNTLIDKLSKMSGGGFQIQSRKYRGVELHQINVKIQGFFFVPTYAVVDDWFVFSFYPQPLQGLVLRKKGKLPSWTPSKRLEDSLAKLPKKFTAISVVNPRPGMKQILTWAPLLATLGRSFSKDIDFDISRIPNANEVCKPLFPNVSVVVDDGKSMQMITRASISVPIEPSSLLVFGAFAAGMTYFQESSAEEFQFRNEATPVPQSGIKGAQPIPPGNQIPPPGPDDLPPSIDPENDR